MTLLCSMSLSMSLYFGRLGMRLGCMLATMHFTGLAGASNEMESVLWKSFRVVVLMKLKSRSIDEVKLVGSGPMTHWML